MPELPEVQTVVNSISPRTVGARITQLDIDRPGYIRPAGCPVCDHLAGRTINAIRRRGKRIIFDLDDGNHFLIHLGMTGRLLLRPAGSDRPKHTHVVIGLIGRHSRSDSFELHLRDPRRFGRFIWLGADTGESGLGIEPLTMPARSLQKLLSASGRPIKALLLDQTRIAGLGNIYVDESLFAAGIHPTTPANAITPTAASRLSRCIKQVLKRALKNRGSTVRDYVDPDGIKGGFQTLHAVYNRGGQACIRCRNPVQKMQLAGRSTWFCLNCQPLPSK